MEHPFDHRHHHHYHHHNSDTDGDNRQHENAVIYPPPGVNSVSYDQTYGPPPPFGAGPPPPFGPSFDVGASHHVSHDQCYDPSPPLLSSAAVPPPHLPFGGDPVLHISHEASHGSRPGFAERVSHESCDGGSMNQQRTVRIFTKAEENYSLSVMDGSVVLARKDPTDPRQHWIKDLKYSTKIKDEEGFPAFALVNKATGEAVKHSFGATKPVRLIMYDPSSPDESVLWSESKDLGDGFRCIRMVNNIRLNFDAFHGDENHDGVHDGTIVVLWEWLKGKNQRWKIVPY